MILPTATYRLQFRNGMTFDRAAALAPYLRRLGISHLYASPIFTANSGSTHGYDMVDANEIEPAIGGRDGFERMAAAMKAEGLGIILDIVPNHMAASLENAWWRDVIENGEKSRYFRHFDIDWSRRLTLPFLGDTFEKVLEAGEISVASDPRTGRTALAYFDTHYPLRPGSYDAADPIGLTDKAAIAALHDRQPYRLMSWRDARRDLTYRRFFEITGLVGTRVEDEVVFDDMHRLILDLVRDGVVHGLRVDHVDGLSDPKGYLDRLRSRTGPDCYIIVEKILARGEHLPGDWPVSGTTGYEFIAALSEVFVDSEDLSSLRSVYESVIGVREPVEAQLRRAKERLIDKNFAGEFANLVRLAVRIGEAVGGNSALPEHPVGSSLRELLIGFDVYRTYGTPQGLPVESRTVLAEALDRARQTSGHADPDALDLLERILAGDVGESAGPAASEFRTRFQQLTGPLMAKSVEDTLFYRHNMALALNEVGADPRQREFSLDRFHTTMQARLERQPEGLSATSTHDTKRGEDARARLFALGEAPERWGNAVQRWRAMNEGVVVNLTDGPAPEAHVEWMLYQALAGAWPADLEPDDQLGLADFERRFCPYVEKALREAKLRTDWRDVRRDYEQAVIGYARWLLSPLNAGFLRDFTSTLQPYIRAGLANSLVQTVIKLTAPGVVDIYQGCEGLDFSLVDPDNRREPDFTLLARRLERGFADPEGNPLPGDLKQHVVQRLLQARSERPVLFREGAYLPLAVRGPSASGIVAFARVAGGDAIIVVGARFTLRGLLEERPPSSRRRPGTEILLPDELAGRAYRDLCFGGTIKATPSIDVSSVLGDRDFSVLHGRSRKAGGAIGARR